MKQKYFVALFLFVILAIPSFASSSTLPYSGPYTLDYYEMQSSGDAEPYTLDEFPLWAQDLRRFEVIFFGSIPLMFALTNLVYDFAKYASHNFSPEYRMGGSKSQDDIKNMLIITGSLSGAIALGDFIITKVKRSQESKDLTDKEK